jgi:replicative DNA helicase
MEKQLPSDMGAEQGLLCSCIQDTRIIGKIADIITLEHFNTPAHQDIWTSMLKMYFDKKPIDLLTITSELSASNLLDGIGGEHYITHVCTVVYSSANWDEYLKTICDCHLRRKIGRAHV